MIDLVEICGSLDSQPWVSTFGKVLSVRRDSIRISIPQVQVGALCNIHTSEGYKVCEVVALDPEGHVAMPLDDLSGVQLGDKVTLKEKSATLPVGRALLGKVIDSLGNPYLGGKIEGLTDEVALYGQPLNPLKRRLISEPIDLGVRSVNSCLTCGKGQRQGIFAGSGVGKSVLLGMMARYTSADVVVISLLGERGREVNEFIENELGPEGLKKSIVVVETSDKSSVRRVRGAFVASAISEYFRAQGCDVLLMMDSLTRFAMAQREIGLAAGEPPTSKGYTPSVFSQLARLLERAGNGENQGSVTGLYTVLVEGDDLEDPIADSTRAILDGHIVLSRKLANRGHYPSVDILSSVSRVMDKVASPEQVTLARKMKELLARYQDNEDAINYGMYLKGSDLNIDEAIDRHPLILDFLKQARENSATLEHSLEQMRQVFS